MSGSRTSMHPVVVTGIAINAFILAVAVWIGRSGGAMDRLVTEDGLAEWLQFLSFTMLSLLLALVAVDRWMKVRRIRLDVLGLAGLSAVVALAALEEISWFQRVLQVETPEFFQQHNRQGETNLHNLALGDSSINKSILVKLIFLVGITHNLVLPLLALRFAGVRRLMDSLGLYLPPLVAAVSYLAMVAISQVLFDHPRRGEFGEVFGAVHYLSTAFAAYVVGVGYTREPVFANGADRTRVSVLFSVVLMYLVLVAWLLTAMSLRAG